MLRQIEWEAQNGPITKNQVLPLTTFFFVHLISVWEPLKKRWFNVLTTYMIIFINFVNVWVLFQNTFFPWISLINLSAVKLQSYSANSDFFTVFLLRFLWNFQNSLFLWSREADFIKNLKVTGWGIVDTLTISSQCIIFTPPLRGIEMEHWLEIDLNIGGKKGVTNIIFWKIFRMY